MILTQKKIKLKNTYKKELGSKNFIEKYFRSTNKKLFTINFIKQNRHIFFFKKNI